MHFEHVRIDDHPPCGRLGFCLTPDLTGNGRPDILVGGMGRAGEFSILGKDLKLRRLPFGERIYAWRESNVFWYENPGWERHDVVSMPNLSVGGSCADIDGDGQVELVAGQNAESNLYWFDPPHDPRAPWTPHLITDQFRKYHDTEIADVDGDGDDELIILSQRSEVVCYYDIPEDPRISPWPADHLHVIADELNVEGVAVADIDQDGVPDLIAGPNVFTKNGSPDNWERKVIDEEWVWTRVETGDLDGDGRDEIVMTEGDLPYQGDRNGRVGIVDTETWTVDVVEEDLFCPHTIQLADFTGDGRLDMLVGEMSLGEHHSPRLLLYRNEGAGQFRREELDVGVATHEAKVTDLNGDGMLDIVGKSYGPRAHVDAWIRRD